jgi:hypothetical protein
LTFTIVIIGLIVANSKKKSKIKTQSEKIIKMDVFFNARDIQQDKTIKDLNSELKFINDLIHGYKKDVETAKGMENIWRTTCDKQYKNHLENEQKLKEAIEHLELLIRESISHVDELTFANKDWEKKCSRLQCEFYNETYTLNQIIDEYSLYILNNAK